MTNKAPKTAHLTRFTPETARVAAKRRWDKSRVDVGNAMIAVTADDLGKDVGLSEAISHVIYGPQIEKAKQGVTAAAVFLSKHAGITPASELDVNQPRSLTLINAPMVMNGMTREDMDFLLGDNPALVYEMITEGDWTDAKELQDYVKEEIRANVDNTDTR